jgi:hypothetical protein
MPSTPRFALIGANPPVRAKKVLGVAYLLHQIDCQGPLGIECRKRLLPSMLQGMSSAHPVVAAVLITFLLLRVHRSRPSAPCNKDSALRPVELL